MCWTVHSPLFFREIAVADYPVGGGGENLHVNGVGATSVVPSVIPTHGDFVFSPGCHTQRSISTISRGNKGLNSLLNYLRVRGWIQVCNGNLCRRNGAWEIHPG